MPLLRADLRSGQCGPPTSVHRQISHMFFARSWWNFKFSRMFQLQALKPWLVIAANQRPACVQAISGRRWPYPVEGYVLSRDGHCQWVWLTLWCTISHWQQLPIRMKCHSASSNHSIISLLPPYFWWNPDGSAIRIKKTTTWPAPATCKGEPVQCSKIETIVTALLS